MLRGRILTTDEAIEKRWLFDTLRYNLQNFSDGLQLEDKDFESSIDKYVSFLLQIRNNLLALVGFVATIVVSLGTTSQYILDSYSRFRCWNSCVFDNQLCANSNTECIRSYKGVLQI